MWHDIVMATRARNWWYWPLPWLTNHGAMTLLIRSSPK